MGFDEGAKDERLEVDRGGRVLFAIRDFGSLDVFVTARGLDEDRCFRGMRRSWRGGRRRRAVVSIVPAWTLACVSRV